MGAGASPPCRVSPEPHAPRRGRGCGDSRRNPEGTSDLVPAGGRGPRAGPSGARVGGLGHPQRRRPRERLLRELRRRLRKPRPRNRGGERRPLRDRDAEGALKRVFVIVRGGGRARERSPRPGSAGSPRERGASFTPRSRSRGEESSGPERIGDIESRLYPRSSRVLPRGRRASRAPRPPRRAQPSRRLRRGPPPADAVRRPLRDAAASRSSTAGNRSSRSPPRGTVVRTMRTSAG